MGRQINTAGIELVKKFEGFYANAYLCPAGVWTIGYGHTSGVRQGQSISQEEAEEFLIDDLKESASYVEQLISVSLTDNQFSTLVSFTFNVGSGNLKNSTLRKKLNMGHYHDVPEELNRWTKSTDPVTKEKKILRGLVRRRAAEVELWLTQDGITENEIIFRMPQKVDDVDAIERAFVPTLEQVGSAFSNLGFKIFDGKDPSGFRKNFDLNIFGIRSAGMVANSFDDWIGVFWMNWDIDQWEYHIWSATTDPGVYWLENPCNVSGTAILVEGQYRSCFQIGLHKGYKALVQCRPVKVYRDKNKDEILDMIPNTFQPGLFGINIHRASADHRSIKVDKWSAGCQVIADPSNFARLMDICDLAQLEWGPTFTYTLLTRCRVSD